MTTYSPIRWSKEELSQRHLKASFFLPGCVPSVADLERWVDT